MQKELTFKTRLQKAARDDTCDGCDRKIPKGRHYIRLLWSDGLVARWHLLCFQDEFNADD